MNNILQNIKSDDIVYASEFEEFFWEEDDMPLVEGTPVGIDVENGSSVDLVLFNGIYWNPDES